MTGLAGRRVLVTGASSGIGEATARAVAAAGARVAVLARRVDRLEALAAEIGAVAVAGDLSDITAAPELMHRTVAGLGGLDALVNSAGLIRPSPIAAADPDDWRAMFDVNVLGLLAITQQAIPHLRRTEGGSIVNISSMSGRRVPTAAGGTYAATKFAVHAISEALRLELQPQGIRVTTISPGFVDTEIMDGLPAGATRDRFSTLVREVGLAAGDVAAAIVHALAAPSSVTTVEVALMSTRQHDGAYKAAVDADQPEAAR